MKDDRSKPRRRGLVTSVALLSLVLATGAVAQVERAQFEIHGLT